MYRLSADGSTWVVIKNFSGTESDVLASRLSSNSDDLFVLSLASNEMGVIKHTKFDSERMKTSPLTGFDVALTHGGSGRKAVISNDGNEFSMSSSYNSDIPTWDTTSPGFKYSSEFNRITYDSRNMAWVIQLDNKHLIKCES